MTDFKAKCTKFDFGWGSAPDPAGGAYSAPPDPLAGFGGRFAAEEGLGWGRGGKGGRGGMGSGGEGKRGPQVTVEPCPSEPCYATDGKVVIYSTSCRDASDWQRWIETSRYAGDLPPAYCVNSRTTGRRRGAVCAGDD